MNGLPLEHSTDLEPPSMHRHVTESLAAWKEEGKALAKLASAFNPLTKATNYKDLAKLPVTLDAVHGKIRSMCVADRGAALLQELRADLDERKRRMRESLAGELKNACAEHGLDLHVIRREEPIELRIPPFAVHIDREKGQAKLFFARYPIAECEADGQAIVKAHGKALATLSKGFSAYVFFDACFKAWRAACGAGSAGTGERVEILDFLPYLAMQMQPKAFRVEPSERNFRGYGRARFAFDMHRLRREGGLNRDGWRINLGVATGTTATKKDRAIFFEDGTGNGEFKLTVFFTKVEATRLA